MAASCPVSVIIPTRERGDLLGEALESVLSQTRPPGEMIVANDGAPLSAQLTDRFRGASRPVLFISSPQRGSGAARNAGAAKARFPLLAFLDDDDLWRPEKLARQVEFMERHPEACLVACQWEDFDDRPVERPGLRRPEHGGRGPRPTEGRRIPLAWFCLKNPITTSGVVVRENCFREAGGFDESLPLAQDWDLWLRIASRWPVYMLGEPLVHHRCHSGNISLRRGELRRCENQLLGKAWRKGGIRGWPRLVLLWRLAWSRYRLARARRRTGGFDMERTGRESK